MIQRGEGTSPFLPCNYFASDIARDLFTFMCNLVNLILEFLRADLVFRKDQLSCEMWYSISEPIALFSGL